MIHRAAMPLVFACLVLFAHHARAEDATPWAIVHCYSPTYDTVEDKYRGDCTGTIVSDAEAQRIRQSRVERNKHAMRTQRYPVDPSMVIKSTGTGFFVSSAADVVTNAHVAEPCAAITIDTIDGKSLLAHLVASDASLDLALLKTDPPPPATLWFRANVDFAGQPVSMVGFPDQGMVSILPVTTPGILSGPSFGEGGRFAFRADVRPGDSGGPILDTAGLVVGVVAAKVNTVSVFQQTGQSVNGIGFGISSATVKQFLAARGVAVQQADGPLPPGTAGSGASPEASVVHIACWRQ